MNPNRQLTAGLILAALSFVLTLGGILAASAENGRPAQVSSATPGATETPRGQSGLVTPTPGVNQAAPTSAPATATFPPAPSATPPGICVPPAGWQAIVVGSGETLASLAQRYRTTPEALAAGNCLLAPAVSAGSLLFVPNLPPSPTATSAPQTPCGPPAGWVRYTIRTGDTLYSLGRAFGVSVAQLQFANCLGTSTYIRAGDLLWVPNVATITPTKTLTASPTRTSPATATATATATSPASSTPTSSATATATETPTASETPTATETPSPTATTP